MFPAGIASSKIRRAPTSIVTRCFRGTRRPPSHRQIRCFGRGLSGPCTSSSLALRKASRHDVSGFDTRGCCPAMLLARTASSPRRPLRRRSGRQADRSANNGAGPLTRGVAGPRDVRGVDCFGHAGTPFPPRLRGATNCGRQYARHHWITKGFCLAALAAAALQGELRPVTTGFAPPTFGKRNRAATFRDCLRFGSDGAFRITCDVVPQVRSD